MGCTLSGHQELLHIQCHFVAQCHNVTSHFVELSTKRQMVNTQITFVCIGYYHNLMIIRTLYVMLY